MSNPSPTPAPLSLTAATMALRRELRREDVEQVRRLVAATGRFSEDEVLVAVELVEERWRRGAASGYEFVFVELDGRTLGYACFGPVPCTRGSWDLYWIAVDPNCQGHGIGRLLMREVEAAVAQRQGRRIYIDTSGRPQYAATRAFYERCGYRVAAVLDEFYAPADSKFIYCRALPPSDPATRR